MKESVRVEIGHLTEKLKKELKTFAKLQQVGGVVGVLQPDYQLATDFVKWLEGKVTPVTFFIVKEKFGEFLVEHAANLLGKAEPEKE